MLLEAPPKSLILNKRSIRSLWSLPSTYFLEHMHLPADFKSDAPDAPDAPGFTFIQ
jgi:hypothetical protein